MPLPTDPIAVWPPPDQHQALHTYRKWGAWWSGSLEDLARVYYSAVGFGDPVIDGRDRRGLAAIKPRMFHGVPAARGGLRSAKLHIPLASDIAATSADLLFGEPPALVAPADDAATKSPDVTVKQTPTQDRLDDYMANGLQAVLLEAAEIAAAFGGAYIRVGWDAQIVDRPLFDAIPPDAAVPEFRSGQLTAVTFHRRLTDQGDGKVWRHLERHEPGLIFHGLYASGDDKTLGAKMPLAAHPETAPFAQLVGGGDRVETGATSLAAEYVPNMRPNRTLRGSQLGRSDLDGIESLMDALDEAWSSWMRDLRLGKGRLVVPEVYLESQGRGNGSLFDAEQEVYQAVNALPGGAEGLAMTNVQFNIRVTEHQQTCASLIEQAVRAAGYSAQTFGMQGDGALMTATEVTARQSRSVMTRGKKINYWRPPLARLTRTALEIDIKQFRPQGVVAVLPDIEWPDGVAADPMTQAQTLQLLRGAQAASTRTLVEMLHADWDDTRIDEEVKAIEAEGQPPAGSSEPPAPGTSAALVGPDGLPVPKPDPVQATPAQPASGVGETPTGVAPAKAAASSARPTPRGPSRRIVGARR